MKTMDLYFPALGTEQTSIRIFPEHEEVFVHVDDELKRKVAPLLSFDLAEIDRGPGRCFFLLHDIQNDFLSYRVKDGKIITVENLSDLAEFEDTPFPDKDFPWRGMELVKASLDLSMDDLKSSPDWETTFIDHVEDAVELIGRERDEGGLRRRIDRYSFFGGAAVPIQTGYLADLEDMDGFIGQMDPGFVDSFSQVLYLFDGGESENGEREFLQIMQMT